MAWSMRPSARQRITGSDARECLAPLETTRRPPQEGDAFLVRVRMCDVMLLMAGGLYTRCFFGMHRPYT